MMLGDMQPLERFLIALKAPETKRQYPKRLAAFLDFLRLRGTLEEKITSLVGLTQNLYLIIQREISLKDFWNNIPARNKLRGELINTLISYHKEINNILEKRNLIAGRVMEVAERNNDIILYGK